MSTHYCANCGEDLTDGTERKIIPADDFDPDADEPVYGGSVFCSYDCRNSYE